MLMIPYLLVKLIQILTKSTQALLKLLLFYKLLYNL